MASDSSRHLLAVITEIQGQPDQLDRGGCDPGPAIATDVARALAKIENLQESLASLRLRITETSFPLSMGERTAAAHHLQVLAGSLGVLHQAFRRIASEHSHARQ